MSDQAYSDSLSLEVSLISLIDRELILPSVAIVEVVSLTMPQVVAKMPHWFLGFLAWQGLRIPFISFETVCGSPFKITSTSNVVILKTTTESLNNKFFAMLIQNMPISYTITKEAIVEVVGELSVYELDTVQINDSIVRIPNIPALEQLMIEVGALN